MLNVEGLNAYYGPIHILHDIDLSVDAGQIVALVGANAAGKSTLMFSLAGLRTICTGKIAIGAVVLNGLPANERVKHGLVLVPERRRLFPFMTVLENLEIGAYAARKSKRESLEYVYSLIPLLAERRRQFAGSLSGGEQQMLAIGRGLMAKPKVLLLDEPTEGLAPIYVKVLYELIRNLRDQNFTILIVEQGVHHVLQVADKSYVIENGRIVLQGNGKDLLGDERLKAAYLGL